VTDAASTTLPPPRQSIWRNVSFMLMWTSVAASGFGDRMIQLAAEPLLGVKQDDASAAVVQAGIMFFFLLPYMGFTLIGGWLADRFPRKWIMLACDEGRFLALLTAWWFAADLAGAQAVPPGHRWKIYLVLFLTGMLAALFNPSRQSIMPQIVRPYQLQTANAVLAGISLIASLVGLLAGGPIVEKVSVQIGIIIGALAFGVSGIFFAFLKPRDPIHAGPAKRLNFFAQVKSAVIYIHRHRAVRHLVLLNILFWVAGYVFNAAIAALCRTHYDIPIDHYLTAKSVMLGTLGGGLIAASLFVMWLRTRHESAIVAMSAAALAGLCMIILAFNRSYAAALFFTFLTGVFGGVFLITIDTLTQLITPNNVRGRVFGLRTLLNTVSGVLINFAIWQLPQSQADHLMVPVLVTSSLVLVAVSLISVWRVLITGPIDSKFVNALWHLNRLYCFVWHRLRIVGKHHVPHDGPVLIAPNHTTGLDPFVVQSGINRLVHWVMLTSYQYPVLNFFWRAVQPIALERSGTDLSKLRAVVQRLRDNEAVGLFPEGALQREHRQLKEFEPGVGMIAKRGKAVVVPVWIHGTPRKHHMFWHFACPSRTTVIFGQPIIIDDDMNNEKVVHELRDRMQRLQAQCEDLEA